jgi:hypothetical protein
VTLAEKLAKQELEKRKQAQAIAAKEGVTAAELEQVTTLLKEADDLKAQGAKALQREETLAENERRMGALRAPVSRLPGASEDDEPIVAKPAFLKDPKRGYSGLRGFLQDVIRSRHGKPSEQLRSLRPSAAYLDGLPELEAAAGTDEASTFYDPSLGAMVPAALLPGLLTTPAPDDPFPDTTRGDINVGVVEMRARVDKDHSSSVSGGLRMYRRAESQAGTASRAKVEKITLRADALMGVTFETEELLRDAPGLVFALIEKGMQDESKAVRIQEIISGDGVGRNLGFRNSGCVITVAKETGQAAGTITYDNLTKLLARGWGKGRFVANKTCIPQLAKLNAGTNGLVWQPSARDGLPGTLLGMPITYTEFLPTLGQAGDIVLVAPSEYLEVWRQDLETEESIHVRFLENERAFRFTLRRGGAPWWRSALTPKNGDTLSPWVELAART